MALADVGWNEHWAARFAPWADRADHEPARIVVEFNYLYRVHGRDGEAEASLSFAGLSDLLAGAASASEVLRPTTVPGLTILPAGCAFNDPAALLALPKFADFLRSSGRHFDCIVFDSPPLMAVADAAHLAPHVSGTVFVVRGQKTTRRAAQLALARLEESGGRVLGVVLNGADIERHGFYYHPYYRREYTSYYTQPSRS